MSTSLKSCIACAVLLLLAACGGSESDSSGNGDGARAVVPRPKPVVETATKPKKQVRPRAKRVRLDMVMIKALFGNYVAAPQGDAKAPTPGQIALGRMLYHDKHLSRNGDVSCATCHDLAKYGQDGRATSPGSAGTRGSRNTPTTWNAFRHFAQRWDYRAASVEEQSVMALLDPTQHGLRDEAELVAKVEAAPELVAAFGKAFPGKNLITAENVGLAIGAFQRTLVTRSRWDEFLDGDSRALNPAEKLGLKTFMDVGCSTCHMSRLLGGTMPRQMGVFAPYPNQKDAGRYAISGNEAERLFFKVPSLINVEKTAPYNHDGSVATLEDSVKQMAKLQLGKELSVEQVEALLSFLKALTGELPSDIVSSGR